MRGWRTIHVAEFALLLVGVALLGYFCWDQASARWEQHQAEAELERSIEERAAEPPTQERPRPAQGETIGKVEIPRLNISAVVKSGVDDKTLKRAVGHVPYTSLPGEPGNVGIAAHRDTYFRNLKGVRKGDVIRMVTPEATYEYAVDSTKIVTPKNVEVLDPTKDNYITLVTCYPFNYVGSAPKRFIVHARQVAGVPAEEARATGRDRRVAATRDARYSRRLPVPSSGG